MYAKSLDYWTRIANQLLATEPNSKRQCISKASPYLQPSHNDAVKTGAIPRESRSFGQSSCAHTQSAFGWAEAATAALARSLAERYTVTAQSRNTRAALSSARARACLARDRPKMLASIYISSTDPRGRALWALRAQVCNAPGIRYGI